MVFTLDSGYKLYNDLHARKLSLVPGQRKAFAYRLFDAAFFPAFRRLVLFAGGMVLLEALVSGKATRTNAFSALGGGLLYALLMDFYYTYSTRRGDQKKK